MSAAITRRRMLAIVRTDNTFLLESWRGEVVWAGRCIHCRSRLYVAQDGTPYGRATVEHIVPQTHGGGDDPINLALACAACNHEKGVRHDRQRRGDAGLEQVIAALQVERGLRWRAEEEAPTRPVPRG